MESNRLCNAAVESTAHVSGQGNAFHQKFAEGRKKRGQSIKITFPAAGSNTDFSVLLPAGRQT
jgi:hypothetical protein